MERRALLAVAAAATTGIAGCLEDGTGGGDPDSTPTETAEPTKTDEPTETDASTETTEPTETDGQTETETPAETPEGEETRMVDREFEVTRVECGSEYDGPHVATEDGVVTVEGTLDGSNTCYTAELVTGEYDAEADELHVEVESVEDSEEGAACAECIVEIDYVARFEFENGEPSSVRADQRGASRESSSGSGSASEGGSGDGY